MQKGIVVASAVAIAALVGTHPANAGDTIKIGTFATLEGTYTALGEDGMRGFDLAVMQHKGMAGGKKLEIIRGSSDASPNSALRAAKKLVEQNKVDILLAPLYRALKVSPCTTMPRASRRPRSSTVAQAPWRPLMSSRRRTSFAQYRWLQMHKGLGQYIYNAESLQEDRDAVGGLCVHLHAGVRAGAGLLPAWR